MAECTAKQAAEFMIAFSQEVQEPITNLKLQKLLYYAQGWHLALYGQPLFDDPIQAWPHGPVVPRIYGEYKHWRWNPIADEVASPKLSDHVSEHLKEVMDVYGALTAYHLEQLTHKEEPWTIARAGIPYDEPSNEVITQASMTEYFRKVAAANANQTA